MKTIEIFTKEDLINFQEKQPNGFLRALQESHKLKTFDSDYDGIEEQIKISDVIGAIGKDGVLNLEKSFDGEIEKAKKDIKDRMQWAENARLRIKRMQAVKKSIETCQTFKEAFKIIAGITEVENKKKK